MNKKAVVVISFGTSVQRAWDVAISPTEKKIADGFKEYHFERAITSSFIRALLLKKGEAIFSPEEALCKLIEEGYEEILIQPLHILPGFEYEKIQQAIQKLAGGSPTKNIKMILGKPLLEGSKEVEEVTTVLKETVNVLARNEKVILIGHGTQHPANSLYRQVEEELHKQGVNAIVGTIEEGPDAIVKKIEGALNILLVPLLFVAGDHVLNDLMGDDEEAWVKKLKMLGYHVRVHAKGLGENESFQELYLKRLQEAKKREDTNV
jgi:sirohydrochlorin cobaltochelatase